MNAKLQWLRNKMVSLDLQGLIVTNRSKYKIFNKYRSRRNVTINKKRKYLYN